MFLLLCEMPHFKYKRKKVFVSVFCFFGKALLLLIIQFDTQTLILFDYLYCKFNSRQYPTTLGDIITEWERQCFKPQGIGLSLLDSELASSFSQLT